MFAYTQIIERQWWRPFKCCMVIRFWIIYILVIHDDVIKWKHFPRYWSFVRGIHRSPVNSPHTGQWRRALMFTLICARVNNGEAGDFRCHRVHYDVIVMITITSICRPLWKHIIQKKRVVMRDQRAWLWRATLDWNVGLAEAKYHQTRFRPSSPSTPIVRY